MKVALIGDIHANLYALEAVLEHCTTQGAEEIWNIGDFVGYGPFPEETVQRIRSLGVTSILGNYDRKVLQVPRKLSKWQNRKNPQKIFAFQWAYENLSEESRAYLASLPEQITLTKFGHQILLTHASPASRDEHLSPSTPDSRFLELSKMNRADIIIFGHSHQPFVRQVSSTWFINTGSVGRPDDGDPRACYAILQLETETIAVQHYRLVYDLEKTVCAILEKKLPGDFAIMLKCGRNLDAIQTAR